MITAISTSEDRAVIPSDREVALAASRLTRQRMLKAMRVLESALAKATPSRESVWKKAVVTALTTLEEVMQAQASELSAEEGLFADLLREEPRLESRIRRLRRQHQDLMRRIGALREEFSQRSGLNSRHVADVRRRLAWLLMALREFQSRETDTIYEAIQVDIGAGD